MGRARGCHGKGATEKRNSGERAARVGVKGVGIGGC